eukprot:scaffold6539_cov66-Phaeocystis_antarctica.AAC.7
MAKLAGIAVAALAPVDIVPAGCRQAVGAAARPLGTLGAHGLALLPPLLVAARPHEHRVVELAAGLADVSLLLQLGQHDAQVAIAVRRVTHQLRMSEQPLVDLDDVTSHAGVHGDLGAVADVDGAHHVSLAEEDRARLLLAGDCRVQQRWVVRRDAEDEQPIGVVMHALVVTGGVGGEVALAHGRELGPPVHQFRERCAVDVALGAGLSAGSSSSSVRAGGSASTGVSTDVRGCGGASGGSGVHGGGAVGGVHRGRVGGNDTTNSPSGGRLPAFEPCLLGELARRACSAETAVWPTAPLRCPSARPARELAAEQHGGAREGITGH